MNTLLEKRYGSGREFQHFLLAVNCRIGVVNEGILYSIRYVFSHNWFIFNFFVYDN